MPCGGHAPMSQEPAPTAPSRVLSIDIFRGLTMLVMIFVNDLAGVRGLPWWNYHIPSGVNGMTYVDVVFPAFLFIVGMAIPLAVERRLERDPSMWRLWRHILLRFAALAVLGIFIANWPKFDPALTGLSKSLWSLTGFAGAILLWNAYPQGTKHERLFTLMRWTGFAMLFAMLAIFRRSTPDGQSAWLDFGYWEILGLIARTYLAVSILYIPLRRKPWAPAALLIALCALNVITRTGITDFPRGIPFWFWPFGRGDLASITMAGIVASQIFLNPASTFARKARLGAAYAASLFLAGWLTIGFGIGKIGATPTWCLWSASISAALFLLLYWIVDVARRTRWAEFMRPAGSNTLLTYLIPDIWYAAFGSLHFGALTRFGWPGAVKSAVFTAIILAFAAVLTRLRIRMQL